MYDDSVEKKYEKAFEQAGYLQPGFAANAKREMAQMVEIMARSHENMDSILSTNQNAAVKGGFMAEEFHAETFNLDATLKGDNAKAYTDRYEEWGNLEWNGAKLRKNDVPDIVVSRDGKVTTTTQAKYYDSAEKTSAEMSQTSDGKIKYENVNQLLGPEDQVNPQYKQVPGESKPVATTTIRDHANAKADALQARNGDKTEIEAYRQTAKKNTDKLTDEKSSSTALSKDDANKLGSGDKSKLEKIESEYQTKSTLKQMGNAAVGAAAISAVVSGSMNTVRYIQLAREGRLTAAEATIKIVSETVAAAADSAVKASANAGVQSLMVRYGSEKVAMEVLAKQGLKSMMKSNAVTVGVVCAVDAVKDLVLLGMGNLTKEEFFEHQGKGLMTTSAGVVGGSLGMAGATSIATVLGAGSGSLAMTAASLVGALSGSMIAGLAMSLAIENGVEKPYKDLVSNTITLHAAARELDSVSRVALQTQTFFLQYLQADAELEEALQDQFDRIDQAGARALDAINRI